MNSLRALSVISLSVALLLSYSASLWASQAAQLLKDVSLRALPNHQADEVAQASQGDQVLLLQRKGGWYRAQLGDQQMGWLRMLDVRMINQTEVTSPSISSLLKNTALVSPLSNVSTGVRGMSDEELAAKEAEDADQQVEKINQYVPTQEETDRFAREGALQTQAVEISRPE